MLFRFLFLSFLLISGSVFSQKKFHTCHEISVDEFHALNQTHPDIFVIDIRSEEDFIRNHIKGAVRIRNDSALRAVSKILDADQFVLVYDDQGDTSIDACLLMASEGLVSVYHLKGGIRQWIYLGFPLVKEPKKDW
jgi:rhodanese-related sulfurtransferase